MRLSTVWMQQAGVNAITQQQAKLTKTQLQLASGKTHLTPADDPIASARALNLKEAMRKYQQYQDNAALAANRLALEEATLSSITEIVQRIRELSVQANNQAVLRAEDKSYIAHEVRQALGELLGLGNSTNGQGEYLFAGTKAHTPPYPLELSTPPGYYAYQGGDGQRLLQIGPTRRIADGDPGSRVFEAIVTAHASPDEVIEGSLTPPIAEVQKIKVPALAAGSVVELSFGSLTLSAGPLDSDPSISELVAALESDPNYASAPFTLTEGTGPDAGKLIITWNAPGEVVNKAELAKKDNLFSLVDQFARALEGALPEEVIPNSLLALDNALERLSTVRSDLGARLNAIETQRQVNAQFILDMQSTLSQGQDLDYAEAIGRFNLEQVALQAAQQAFAKVQGLSLFNFLR
ncbi:MAG: flagellar hook-associated protein FlgL [Methylohalobius sp.]|nr:flagellar hook-associated protein FlgL [Methylohalobius sp.]